MFVDYLGVWLILPLSAVVYFFRRYIHRNEYRFYAGTLIFSVILGILILVGQENLWIFNQLVVEGHVSFALFVIVMYGGAFPLKSKPKKYIMQIRREFALIGFLLLIPHAVYRLSLALGGYNFTGLIAFLIMIPLVIVSYPKVRKKLKPGTWKNVHKMAYIVYLMIYIHVGFVLFVAGSFNQFEIVYDAWPYHAIFILYLILKARVVYLKHKKNGS